MKEEFTDTRVHGLMDGRTDTGRTHAMTIAHWPLASGAKNRCPPLIKYARFCSLLYLICLNYFIKCLPQLNICIDRPARVIEINKLISLLSSPHSHYF